MKELDSHKEPMQVICDGPGGHVPDREVQWLRSILESLPVGVFTVDREWKITSFNRTACEITGWEQDEVLGRPCYQVFQTAVCQRDCPMERALSCAAAVYDREVSFANRLHRRVTMLVNATPLYDPDGNVIGGVETLRDVSALEWMRQELALTYDYSHIVGKSSAMQEVYKRLDVVARTDTTVLILGESGTGKELVARAIHFNSDRRDRPFVSVNCSALPEGILESELFGHVRGAFTGAIRDKVGRFEMANGGTLFLDEIGDLTPTVQVKLLRVLQSQEFRRIGDNQDIRVDVRVITATNKDLEKAVASGAFRQDLFYRINVFPLTMPPLRERKDDIPLLAHHFLLKHRNKVGKRVEGFTPAAMDKLLAYHWPGNVRELENKVHHALVMCQGEHIKPEEVHLDITPAAKTPVLDLDRPFRELKREVVEGFEREYTRELLRRHGGNLAAAARQARIDRKNLWSLVKKYRIDVNMFRRG